MTLFQPKETKTYNKKKKEPPFNSHLGELVHENGTQRGGGVDLLTPSLCTKETLRPRLDQQSVVVNHTRVDLCQRRTAGEVPHSEN